MLADERLDVVGDFTTAGKRAKVEVGSIASQPPPPRGPTCTLPVTATAAVRQEEPAYRIEVA
ncbi:MAG: hypothetical protein ACR2N6_06195 [Miltoncostaeaceae bacterium]